MTSATVRLKQQKLLYSSYMTVQLKVYLFWRRYVYCICNLETVEIITLHCRNSHFLLQTKHILCNAIRTSSTGNSPVSLYNKTNQMHYFHKFILAWNSTCFGQFVCPSSGVYSLCTQQWYMSYRFVDIFFAAVLLKSCLQTCMTYSVAECTVNKLLMMDRRTVRNM